YREATRVNPRMPDAHFNLGNLFLEKGQPGLAIAQYKLALDLRPNWDKALAKLEQAQTAHAGRAAKNQPVIPPPVVSTVATPSALDPNRVIDPNLHGNQLRAMHKGTVDLDKHGREFLRILESEVERAIKELSNCLFFPDTSATELDGYTAKLEA